MRALLGNRIVDIPLRAFALLFFIIDLFGSPESTEPVALILFYLSAVLLAVAPFFPVSVTAVALGLYAAHMLLYPDLINPFQLSILLPITVLVAHGRPWPALLYTGLFFTLAIGEEFLQASLATPLAELALVTGAAWILGVSAYFLENRINLAIHERERLAIAHEQELQRLRVAFIIDTHDTVSHSLATQSAAIRVISHENTDTKVASMLDELSAINEQSQLELRSLLLGLREGALDLSTEHHTTLSLEEALASMIASAKAGGYEIDLTVVGSLPRYSAATDRQLLFIARELVTNIVKHSSERTGCSITLSENREEHGTFVQAVATNPISTQSLAKPQSLARRAQEFGGTCEASSTDRIFTVTVRIPVTRKRPTSLESGMAGGSAV